MTRVDFDEFQQSISDPELGGLLEGRLLDRVPIEQHAVPTLQIANHPAIRFPRDLGVNSRHRLNG